MFAGDLAEQRLDPGLVGGFGPPPEVLSDQADGHELGGVTSTHLLAVVRHCHQQRHTVVDWQVAVEVIEAGGELSGE